MIITTTYAQRLTITTDDAGNVTTTRTETADTHSAYLFHELTPEAQARAISDAIKEEDRNAYEWGSHTYFATDEIIDAARDLEKQQPIRIRQDYGCSWYGEACAHGWSEPYEEVTEATDNGICWSMDMCDKWNEYAPRIIALQEAIEEAADMSGRLWDAAQEADTEQYDAETEAERQRFAAIEEEARAGYQQAEKILEACTCTADALTTEAAQAVGNMVDGLIESAHDYYTSAEFWSEWLRDGETRFTRDGERI